MTEAEFYERYEEVLSRVEDAVDASPDKCWALRQNDNLALELANGSRIIVSRQTPTRQVWVAAKAGGFKYSFDGAAWRNDKGETELFGDLADLAQGQGNARLRF